MAGPSFRVKQIVCCLGTAGGALPSQNGPGNSGGPNSAAISVATRSTGAALTDKFLSLSLSCTVEAYANMNRFRLVRPP